MTDGYSFQFNEGVVTVSMEVRSTGVDEFEKGLMGKFIKFCAEIFDEEEISLPQDGIEWKVDVKPKKRKKQWRW